jgi:hypothetical protein
VRSRRIVASAFVAAVAIVLLVSVRSAGGDVVAPPFRLSFTGPEGGVDFNAFDPAMAYDGRRDRYLAVWCTAGGAEKRIVARFVGGDGVPLGAAKGISGMIQGTTGNCGSGTAAVSDPSVVYNAGADEFLVVWHATPSPSDSNCNPATEIFGQRLTGEGSEVGADDFAISSNFDGCSVDPMVAYDEGANRYLVVWGDEPPGNARRVRSRLLDAEGNAAAAGVQLSSSATLPLSDEPDVVAMPGTGRFLVVWSGGTTLDGEGDIADAAIHGQLVDAATGAEAGVDDFTISPTRAVTPTLTYNARAGEALVLWAADRASSADPPEFEVRGRRVGADGAPRDADVLVTTSARFISAKAPKLAYDPRGDQYQVVFDGVLPGQTESRIFGQRLDAVGARIGAEGFEISPTPGDEEARTVVYNPARCEYLTLWEAVQSGTASDVNTVVGTEIHGRRLDAPACPVPTPTATATDSATTSRQPTPSASPAPAPTPVAGQSVGAKPISGKVLVKLPGSTKFVPLGASVIRNGAEIDTRNGVVELTRSDGGVARFYGGIFKLSQPGGITTLGLSEKLTGCKAASAAARNPKTRKLWGDGKGKFRTRGQYSAATVRGTIWLTQDRCDGTLTRVTQGSVTVRDFALRKSVVVRAGKRYFARRP